MIQSPCLLNALLTTWPSLPQPRALKKTDVAATPTTPTPAGPPHTTPAQTAQGLVTQVPETTARSRSREEQTAAQHTNRPTAQEDSSPSRTQDVGGLVASLMGGDKHDPVPAQDDGSEDPVTNDPAGVVASLLAADSTGFSRPKDHARPAVVQTAQSPDSADLTNPSPAWPEAAESTADISLSGSANTVTTDTLVSNLPPGADTLAQGTKPRLDAPAPTTTNAAVGASEPTFLSTFPGSRSDYPSPAAPEAIMTFGSSSMTITSGQPFVILDQTLSVGGEAVTVHGQHVSAATEGVVVDGVTTAFSKVSAAGEVNATASASESIAVYTGGVSDKHTRRDWVMLWICSGFVHFLLALI